MRTFTIILLPLVLAGCLGSEAPRFVVEPVPSSAKLRTSARTISIANVSLPSYAKETRITVQGENGALVPLPDADWADDPERAMTYALVRHLSAISGAEVAADPWPLGGIPEAEVRVRVEQMVAETSGTMNLSGQFTIRRDRATSRNRIKLFSIKVPAKTADPPDVMRAHDAAWRELAERIARNL